MTGQTRSRRKWRSPCHHESRAKPNSNGRKTRPPHPARPSSGQSTVRPGRPPHPCHRRERESPLPAPCVRYAAHWSHRCFQIQCCADRLRRRYGSAADRMESRRVDSPAPMPSPGLSTPPPLFLKSCHSDQVFVIQWFRCDAQQFHVFENRRFRKGRGGLGHRR